MRFSPPPPFFSLADSSGSVGAIFTTSKKFVFESKADPQILLQKFRIRVGDDNFLSRLKNAYSISGEFVGKIDGRSVEVKYVSMVHNSLQPTMHIHIDSTPTGGSQIRTWFTTHVFVRVFLIIWMLGVVCMSITPLVTPIQGNAELFWVFPLFGIFLVFLMRLIARRDEEKLERLVRDVIESSE